MIKTLIKLSFAGVRSRLLANILTVILCISSAALVILSLEVRETGVVPWQETFEAAHGAHVLVGAPSESDAHAVASLPDVAEYDSPTPAANIMMSVAGRDVIARLIGLTEWPEINTPLITEGGKLQEDGVILERSFARTLGATLGSEVVFATTNGTISLPVIGIAISPSQPRYPRQTPGIGWITEGKLSQIVPDRSKWHWLQTIRVQDPESALAFAEKAAATFSSKPLDFLVWQEQRAQALNDASVINIIVIAYTVLLLIVLYSITTILVGERANKQYRQIGLLKAVGLTPNQISTIFLLESATLGIIAVAIGSIGGVILAPILAAPGAETLISAPMVAPNVWHFFIAALAIIPVLLISTILSTRKSTRFSVLQTIRAGTSYHPSRSYLTKIISRLNLPLPVMLGLKDLLARRKRFLWLIYTIAITGAVVVVTLSLQANINARPFGSDIPKEVPILFYTLDLVLMLIMFTALIAVALLSVGERTREFGILKAIGFTPQQLSSSLIGTHAVLATIASIASIPLGIGLYYFLYLIASGTTDDAGQIAPWWWLAMIPIGITLLAAVATIIPARNAAKKSAVSAIRYE